MLLQLGATLLHAQDPKLRALFPAKAADYLTDQAGIVDAESATQINDLASRLRSATGAELAVVTLPSIGDYAPGDVALAIGRAWGVGAKAAIGDSSRNAGAVMLLVPRTSDHKGQIFISTGQGIEGIVTDAAAGRIRDEMIPELKAEHYGPALVEGVQSLTAMLARGYGVTDTTLTGVDPFSGGADGGGGGGQAIGPFMIFLAIIAIMIISAVSRGRGGRGRGVYWGGPGIGGGGWGGGWGGGFGGGGGGGGGGFGGFGGGGGFSGGGSGGSF
ncbi:MAG: TPM domain-containing protein [Gemmatimonadota bacterium]